MGLLCFPVCIIVDRQISQLLEVSEIDNNTLLFRYKLLLRCGIEKLHLKNYLVAKSEMMERGVHPSQAIVSHDCLYMYMYIEMGYVTKVGRGSTVLRFLYTCKPCSGFSQNTFVQCTHTHS